MKINVGAYPATLMYLRSSVLMKRQIPDFCFTPSMRQMMGMKLSLSAVEAVISLGVIEQINAQLGIILGTGNKTRLLDLKKMAESLGAVCSALPYIHALTGCDSVSSFFGHSKKKAFKILKRLPDSDVTELSSAELGQV